MSGPLSLEGPFFNTLNWDKDFNGVHPVEMLARIAKFENKPEAQFDVCRRPLVHKDPKNDYKKVVICCYDNFTTYGNGKLEKQAKMVSARNMISKIKTKNIGIVNETLASGVTIEKNVDADPHKKPIVRQFRSFTSGGSLSTMSNFKSAGTLGSFVPASTSAESPTSGRDLIKPPVKDSLVVNQSDQEEIEQYKAYIEGKLESPSEKLPPRPETAVIPEETLAATEPKIVFKRSAESEIKDSEDQPNIKKPKEDSQQDWDPTNYGYHQAYATNRDRGRGQYRGYHRGGRGYGYGYGGGSWY